MCCIESSGDVREREERERERERKEMTNTTRGDEIVRSSNHLRCMQLSLTILMSPQPSTVDHRTLRKA